MHRPTARRILPRVLPCENVVQCLLVQGCIWRTETAARAAECRVLARAAARADPRATAVALVATAEVLARPLDHSAVRKSNTLARPRRRRPRLCEAPQRCHSQTDLGCGTAARTNRPRARARAGRGPSCRSGQSPQQRSAARWVASSSRARRPGSASRARRRRLALSGVSSRLPRWSQSRHSTRWIRSAASVGRHSLRPPSNQEYSGHTWLDHSSRKHSCRP